LPLSKREQADLDDRAKELNLPVPVRKPPATSGGKTLGDLAVARSLPDEVLGRWKFDLKNNQRRRAPSLYIRLLAHCAAPNDRQLFADFLEYAVRPRGLDTLLGGSNEVGAAYEAIVRFDPAGGCKVFREGMAAAKKKHNFSELSGCVKALRWLSEAVPEGLKEADLDSAAADLLAIPEVADLVVGDLIVAKNWRLTDRVLALPGSKDFDLPLVRRAVLRYALRCPKAESAKFVEQERRKNPEHVKAFEEALGDE
jgi:hypothetical protein